MEEQLKCASLLENLLKRKSIFNGKERHSLNNLVVLSNIKQFNPQAPQFYQNIITSTLPIRDETHPHPQILLSIEKSTKYRHDFVGLLQLLSLLFNTPNTIDKQKIFILDGGLKSRNYLLTLFFNYQGLYRVLQQRSWEISLGSSLLIAKQLGNDWAIICASDYDLCPSYICNRSNDRILPIEEFASEADLILFQVYIYSIFIIIFSIH